MDETYQDYVNRVMRLTLQDSYHNQLQNIQKSPKFQQGKAVPFPGYSIITTPAGEDQANSAFYEELNAAQKDLVTENKTNFIITVPPASFHLTVADLIWDNAYQTKQQENPQFDDQLKRVIAESFKQYQAIKENEQPSRWQILGLLLFPRAIAVGLVPQDEAAYQSIVQLRRSVYQNANLIALGIEQQYRFTAHITLGYFGEIADNLDRGYLATILTQFNERWLGQTPQLLTIETAQLRYFADMTNYGRESHDPVVSV